ncbi:MAG: ATP-binding cassette domain-containing protein, partial [Vulcanimicrobiaceae bacterium]
MLALDSISKRFAGRAIPQVDHISLKVARDEIVAIVGPSGAGKTTLLRIIAGLGAMDSGSLQFDGRDIASDSPQDRRFALLFQDDVLLPMLSVRAHLTMVSRVGE